jgi:PilZ domain
VGYAHAQQTRPSRLAFAAEVRATEIDSGREVWGETTNLSKGGCYVRTNQSFPEGTLLLIEIRLHRVRFQTDARVAYTVETEGMGLAFLNVPASQRPILQDWLSSTGEDRPREATL